VPLVGLYDGSHRLNLLALGVATVVLLGELAPWPFQANVTDLYAGDSFGTNQVEHFEPRGRS